MKIQELRIGNLVYLVYPDGITHKVEITGILPDKVFFKGKSSGFSMYEAISPIPLTEEILLKCGFDENMVLSTIEGEIRYYGDGDINIGGEDSCTLGMVYIAKCKYLHQLQNLYFALTGKELEVEL